MIQLLQQDSLTKAVTACLKRIQFICHALHPTVQVLPLYCNEKNFFKVFIGSFLIVQYYKRLFGKSILLEEKVVKTGSRMLSTFHDICEAIKRSHGMSHFQAMLLEKTKDFILLVTTYFQVFKEWKTMDEKKVVNRIKYTLEALNEIQPNLGPIDDLESDMLHLEYNSRISHLKNTLVKYRGGQQVLDELELPEVPFSANTRQYPPLHLGVFRCFQNKMSNEQMAHEMLLDPLFQLDDYGNLPYIHPGHKAIRNCYHKSMWRCVLDDLQQLPPNYEKMVGVFEEIIKGLVALGDTPVQQEIRLILDIPYIKNQVSQGMLAWKTIQTLIYGIYYVYQKVQAPMRDEENDVTFKEIQVKMEEAFQRVELQPQALCFAMEKMLNILTCMQMDASNARLRLISHVIAQNGLDYMKEKFEAKLRTNPEGLQRTKRAMDVAVSNFHRHFPHLTPYIKAGENAHAVNMCHFIFFTDIFQGPVLKETNIPETLACDIIRLSIFQRKIHYFAIMVNISAYLKRTLPQDTQLQEVRLVCVHQKPDSANSLVYRSSDLHLKACLLKSNLTPTRM